MGALNDSDEAKRDEMNESVRKYREETAANEHQRRKDKADYKAAKAAGKLGCLIILIVTSVMFFGLTAAVYAIAR